MARIRTIKPDFFTSDTVSALPLRARLTWIGLWTHCDDQGRCRDNVKLIKAAVWPLDDVSLRDIEEDLTTLANCGRIVRYAASVDAKSTALIQVVNWDEHQKINRPSKHRYPRPSLSEGSRNDNPQGYPQTPGQSQSDSPHGTLTEGSSQEGNREQGIGRRERGHAPEEDQRPSPQCPKHQNDLDPPNCGACRNHRLAAEAWDADKPQRAAARRVANRGCPYCDADGWRYQFGRRILVTPYVRCDGSPPRGPDA